MLKKFFEFLQQVFKGSGEGLGSKTANMTVDDIMKVADDLKIDKAEAEKIVQAFLTKNEDKVLSEINTGLKDVKSLTTTDDAALRAEYIDGPAADTMSFEEFKLSRNQAGDNWNPNEFDQNFNQMKADPQNILSGVADETGRIFDEAGETVAVDMTPNANFFENFDDVQKRNKVGSFATDPANISNYDELVKEGYYVGGSLKPGPNHPFNNPASVSRNSTWPNNRGSSTAVVAKNIAQWKQELIRNLEEGIITRDEYDAIYRNADPIFEAQYNKAKANDLKNGYVENTYENRNEEFLMTDYWPGENYAPKYIDEADIPSGYQLEPSSESTLKIQKQIQEEMMQPIIDDTKIVQSQADELTKYKAAYEEALLTGDVTEADRLREIMLDAKQQMDEGVGATDIIFKDDKRTLNAQGGIIKGLKNRGR